MKHRLCIGLACLIAGTAWAQRADVALPQTAKLLSEGHSFPEGPMVDKEGRLYFSDPRANSIHRVDGANVGTITLILGSDNDLPSSFQCSRSEGGPSSHHSV